MQVIEYEPQFWFLAEENDALYLESNCNYGAVGYTFLMQLSTQEMMQYKSKGRAYISLLAQAIQDSAPVFTSASIYEGRDVSAIYHERFNAAVQAWTNIHVTKQYLAN